MPKILGTLNNEPYATAELREVGSKKFLVFETGPAAVIVPYERLPGRDGDVQVLLIRETRTIIRETRTDPSGNKKMVLKTIGGFNHQKKGSEEVFFAHLIHRESSLSVLGQAPDTCFQVIGKFPDFDIAHFPITEVIIHADHLSVREAPPSPNTIWMPLRQAVDLAANGGFSDAAAEMVILRMFALWHLGQLNLD